MLYPKLRVATTLWLSGMCGVLVVAFTVIPQLPAIASGKAPAGAAVAAAILQSGIMVLLAAWAGSALARPLGLGAPVLEAVLAGSAAGAWAALRRQLLPAALAGLLTGALLLIIGKAAPAGLAALGRDITIPVAARLLYGGVTEEVLLRWGVMTGLAWLGWRFLQGKAGPPRAAVIAGAIVGAALLFGALHLPAALSMGAQLDATLVGTIVLGNAVPGAVFGFLYWRFGLEAAMMAHALAHVVALAGQAM